MAEDTPKVPESLPAEPEAPQLPPKERRAARRAATAPAASGPKSAEERDAARLERRAHSAKLRRNYRARAKTQRDASRAAAPAVEAGAAVAEPVGQGRPKVRLGVVVSDKADKTIVVRIDVASRHRRYGKTIRSSSKLHVHDERNDAGTGDTVRVVESRPLSALKRWRLLEVTEKAR